MAGKTRSSFLSLMIIAILVFGAVSPTIVYADDGNPPNTPSPETSSSCPTNSECTSQEGGATTSGNDAEATSQATEEPSVEATAQATSVPTQPSPEATSTPDEAPTQVGSEGNTSGEDAATAAPPATEGSAPTGTESAPTSDTTILDQVPANTTVTVLDTQGQAQPLATQDAATAIATSDPIWCPQGQSPTPGANGCTTSFSSFDALLTFLSGNTTYQGAGTIYVQQGTYNGGETSIDFNSPAYDLSNINHSNLTITGGWNTSTNTVDPTSTSNFNIPILIGTSANPWGGSLFINNIVISKTNGTGLTLYAQNDITISNVTVTNSATGAGAELHAGGNVNISDSKFNRNKTAGAIIRAGANVAIANSSFSNPVGGRVQVKGLDITSGGNVSLASVVADVNREAGANIFANGSVSIANSSFSGTKAMKGSGASTTFLGYGLQVNTSGAINLANVTASDNFLWGASLQSSGDVTITDSLFNANTTASPGFIDDTGLLVTSGGSVTLNNVQANDNRLIGATIQATKDVIISNSTFTNNKGVTVSSGGTQTFHGYGLNVVTPGNINLNNVDASNNTLFGAHLEAGSQVFVSNSKFNNETSGSATDLLGRGLEIISGSNVFLSSVSLDGNQTFGASIQAGGTISLDTVTATNNATDGVDAQGSCTTVSLFSGTYANNGGYGLSVTNADLQQAGSPIFSNNAAGDIFQDAGSCVFPASGAAGGTGNGNSTGSSTSSPAANSTQVASPVNSAVSHLGINIFSGKDNSFSVTGMASQGPTLNSFLTNVGSANQNDHFSIFIGQYAYVYSDYILHIIVLPFSNSLAMAGS